jgi:RNA polymerase sigma factor (TIGR02999 family)
MTNTSSVVSSNLAEDSDGLAQGAPGTIPGDVTRLLGRWAGGDADALGALVPMVYEQLRGLAVHYLRRERAGHTLQPTALVHEAYLRLGGIHRMQLRNRTHFYGAAAQIMRRILVDHARERRALKRGGPDAIVVTLHDAGSEAVETASHHDLVDLDLALQALERVAPARAKVVELRFFGGLSIEETANYLGVSPATVKRYWEFSRAWLFRRLRGPAQAGRHKGMP